MKLTRDDWASVLRLLDEALDLPEPQREPWLAALDADLHRLQPALRQLLDQRRAIETGSFLKALPALEEAPSVGAGFTVGHRIGPYALLRELGQGGMASVWLAERADAAHHREVALKLPHVGARARVMAERFVRERQILSALTHPHIASVLDAGADGAQPWLAIEYVDGSTITEWAAQQQLDIRARLRLFLQVLQAVQHAHAQLVIHRDIKPSNVLVATDGQVKLLDFGVAKLLGDDGTSHETELTQVGGRAMTPQYASPEQVAGQALGTASDVYSLGVLLYELLTGRLPYVLKRDTPAAVEEAILAAHIIAPSAAVAGKVSSRALRGDVDTIVTKALAPKPTDRYASAESMAQDIEWHLQSQPILARPASFGYRLGKLLARHRLAWATGAVATLALVGGAGLALWQAKLAQRQTDRAEAVQKFLSDTLSLNEPDQALGRELSARELLDLSARRIDTQFARDDATRAQLHHSVGGIYVALGAMAAAQPHLEQAVALYESSGQRGTPRHIEALMQRAEVCDELAEFDAARDATRRAAREAERAFGARHRWAARMQANLAWYDLHQGRYAEAKAGAEQALQTQRQLTGEASRDYVAIANELAHVYLDTDEVVRARALFEQLRALGESITGYPEGDRLMDRYNLARVRFVVGDITGVEPELRDLVPRMERHFGPQHDRTIIGRSLLAQTLAHGGRFDEALVQQRATLAAAAARGIAGDEAVAQQTLVLALILKIAGRHDEALDPATRGLAHFDAKYAEPTTYRERGRWILGEVLLGLGREPEGLALLHRAAANIGALGLQGGSLARTPNLLSLAVAERRADGVADACDAIARSTGGASIPAARCRAIEAWLQALAATEDTRAAALQRFIAVRDPLLARLPDRHGLRAELLAAEAEIVQPLDAARAEAIRAEAGAEYRRVFGRELPARLRLMH